MIKFKELGFDHKEKFAKYFFATLLPSNKTYEYFVDWSKVKNNVKKYLEEISLLNSIIKISPSNQEKYLYHLILKYPKVIEVIPILIAERLKSHKIDVFDIETEQILHLEFSSSKINKNTLSKIMKFCEKTKILELFRETKDLYDYLLGIEVGMDTNSRKNRSGAIFEKMVGRKIKRIISNKYMAVDNDPNFSLYDTITNGKNTGKKHDFVIYFNEFTSPSLVIECNFYNVSGSKPESIAESYSKMAKHAKEKGIEFLWVTDGPAWKKMKESFYHALEEMEWISNYYMLENTLKTLLNSLDL